MTGKNRALIDLNALRHNLNRVGSAAPNSRVMAVIKADAYGHGVLQVENALHQADAFALARVDEAVVLRQAGCVKDLVVLSGFRDAEEWQLALQFNLQVVLHHQAQLDILREHPADSPMVVWVKIDSGMHRLGFDPAEASNVKATLDDMPWIESVHWMTHFACADDVEDSKTLHQMASFSQATSPLAGNKSLANSAGILAWPDSHADWVRPGIMLYGATPLLQKSAKALDLKPVMSLCSSVIALREVEAGEAVGYGATWVASRPTKLAVIGIGYGDGYPRQAKPGTPVSIRGQHAPLVGRVSMDSIIVDATDCPGVQLGDPAELWGAEVPVEMVAEGAGTISYHLFCGVTARVPRIYLD